MTEPTQHFIDVNGVSLCYFEWGEPKPGQPVVLLVHATGFHARCWDGVVRHLGQRHVIALDMRGHGRSGKVPPYDWATFGADVTGFVEAMALEQVVGSGHSMGGT